MKSFSIKNFGPIDSVDIQCGDLTVFVGEQAMGKSITLEIVKLIEDAGYIHHRMETFGFDCSTPEKFFSHYFGMGKDKMWREDTKIFVDKKPLSMKEIFERKKSREMKNFYIPAQRVLVIDKGWPTPFHGFDSIYSFVTREFSENIRSFMDMTFVEDGGKIFPQTNRLRQELRESIDKTIFHGQTVHLSSSFQNRKMLLLKVADGTELPITTWSTGQREFIPLLFGIYYCLPPAKSTKKDKIKSIIIEEPEMGLHPSAIVSVMLLVMELLNRGYKLFLSTHSQAVLDIVWVLREIKKRNADIRYFYELFGLKKTPYTMELAESIKKKTMRVNYFKPSEEGIVSLDISSLDPGSEYEEIWGWGGLSSFSGKAAEIVGAIAKDKMISGK